MIIINIILIISIIYVLKNKKEIAKKSIQVNIGIMMLALSLLLMYVPIMQIITENSTRGEIILKYILEYMPGIEGISIIMIVLTALLFIVCVLTGEKIVYRRRLFFILLLISEVLLINVFLVADLFYFYILFETVLIPMFIMIGIWGSRKEKISAAYQFYIYTLLGSLLMLITIVSIMLLIGTTNIIEMKGYIYPRNIEKFFWISLFIAFAIKIPMFPFHIWLPKAHVEAPTAGSVLLAGIMLKLGGYGLIKFSLFLFPEATIYYRPVVILLASIGIIYSSFAIIRQIDLKRIVAYSSIAHMNIVILGCFGGNLISLQGAILLMIAHGLVSGGLFLSVGYLYDRYKSRNILYYRDIKNIMPIFEGIFLLLIITNMGFPPTLNFISELMIISGFFESQQMLILIIGISVLFSGISGFLTYTRICFGNYVSNKGKNNIYYYYDITRREYHAIIGLVVLPIILGLYPKIIMELTNYIYSGWGI